MCSQKWGSFLSSHSKKSKELGRDTWKRSGMSLSWASWEVKDAPSSSLNDIKIDKIYIQRPSHIIVRSRTKEKFRSSVMKNNRTLRLFFFSLLPLFWLLLLFGLVDSSSSSAPALSGVVIWVPTNHGTTALTPIQKGPCVRKIPRLPVLDHTSSFVANIL